MQIIAYVGREWGMGCRTPEGVQGMPDGMVGEVRNEEVISSEKAKK